MMLYVEIENAYCHHISFLGMFSVAIGEMKLLKVFFFQAGVTIIFTHSVFNTGKAYNNGLGVFESLVNGTSSLSASIFTYTNIDSWIVIRLVNDSDVINE